MSDGIITVHVTDLDGQTKTYEGLESYSLMEVIRDHGLPIKAECGGCMCCATCVVNVDEKWLDHLPEQNDDERDLIEDSGIDVTPQTRLSCQIILAPEMDGLKATLILDL